MAKVCTKLDKNYLRLLLDLKITKLRSAYWYNQSILYVIILSLVVTKLLLSTVLLRYSLTQYSNYNIYNILLL